MARLKSGVQIEGMKEFEKMLKKLGKVPQTVATRSARSGATIALRAARRKAPNDSGMLKKGLVLKREKTRIKGKAVYQVTINPQMNDVFVKTSKEGTRSYYPASQEYGFMTKDGGYIPGYRYLRSSLDDNKRPIEKKVLDEAKKHIDKALRG